MITSILSNQQKKQAHLLSVPTPYQLTHVSLQSGQPTVQPTEQWQTRYFSQQLNTPNMQYNNHPTKMIPNERIKGYVNIGIVATLVFWADIFLTEKGLPFLYG